MANTVLESQNSFQIYGPSAYPYQIYQSISSAPVISFRPTDGNQYSSKYPQATVPPVLQDCYCKRDFYSDDPFDSGNTKRPARPAPCLDYLNEILIRLRKASPRR